MKVLICVSAIAFATAGEARASDCSPTDDACVKNEQKRISRDQILDQLRSDEVELIAPSQNARPFELADHRKAVRELTGAGGVCTDWLLSAQWRQDLIHQGDNEAHFDNCAFRPAISFIRAQVESANRAATVAPGQTLTAAQTKEALLALGRAIHALQDFFAHSNYVELQDETLPDTQKLDQIPIPPLWTEEGAQQVLGLAASGKLWSGLWPIGTNLCVGGDGATHGQLAKDSAKTAEGKRALSSHPSWGESRYKVARWLAITASGKFIREAFPPTLRASCGDKLGIVAIREGRPTP